MEIERLLEQREREGLTYAELAKIAGIQPSTMSTWAWRLRRERRESSTPVRDGRATGTGPQQFVELITTDCERPADARIEIELRSGRRIVMTADVDVERLAEIVEVLERC